MIISANTTGMVAALTFMIDKHARESCVVVVKGTYRADDEGRLDLADAQRPLYFVDTHLGDPENSPILHGTDVVPTKPCAEVLVVGNACTENGKPVERLVAGLQIGEFVKQLEVTGDRYWVRVAGELAPSSPRPFSRMPLTYDRAFGGSDATRGEMNVATVPENPDGTGYNPYRAKREVEGTRLPSVGQPGETLRHFRDRMTPVGVGVVGRHYQPRAGFAGTYDQHWLDDIAPFLPADFDSRFFMSSAPDQWCPFFRGGERIRCMNMSRNASTNYIIPDTSLPVSFLFDYRTIDRNAVLDTVVLEPHRRTAMLTWRASVPVGKKPTRLKEIKIGRQLASRKASVTSDTRNGKPHFENLGTAVEWLKAQRHRRR